MQVVGIDELYTRMKKEGLNLPNPFVASVAKRIVVAISCLKLRMDSYWRFLNSGISKFKAVRDYYGFGEVSRQQS